MPETISVRGDCSFLTSEVSFQVEEGTWQPLLSLPPHTSWGDWRRPSTGHGRHAHTNLPAPFPLLPQPLSLCVCLSLSLPLSFSPLQPRTCSLQRKLSTNTHWGCPTPGSVPDVPLPRIWVSFCIRSINNKDAFLFVLFLKWSTNSIKRKRCYLLDSLKPPPSRTPRTDSLKRPIK